MLSFSDGIPVAVIRDPSGEDDGKIIHVLPEFNVRLPELKIKVKNPVEDLGVKFFQKRIPRMKSRDLDVMHKALTENNPPIQYPHLLQAYTDAVDSLNGNIGKEIKLLGDQVVKQIYDPEAKRECDYISGVAGAGKSTYASWRAKNFLQTHRGGKIFMFSELKDDPAFKGIPMIRIVINDELLDNPLRPDEFTGNLVIFDDIDAIIDKALLKVVRKIRDQILAIGRHDDVSVITTTHVLCNGHETKVPINEATSVTFFPQSGSGIDNIRLYFKKAGIPKEKVDKILKLKSRWVTHRKSYPNVILYEGGCFIM